MASVMIGESPAEVLSSRSRDDISVAEALLSVSPSVPSHMAKPVSVICSTEASVSTSNSSCSKSHLKAKEVTAMEATNFVINTDIAALDTTGVPESGESCSIRRRPRSDSAGLDALAALASDSLQRDTSKSTVLTASSTATTLSESSDGEGGIREQEVQQRRVMPPPPPRATGRRRSASNPEGMELWEQRQKRHFVLPPSILEVELAEADAAVRKQKTKRESHSLLPENLIHVYEDDWDDDEEETTSAEVSDMEGEQRYEMEQLGNAEELLTRARSRLFEDLSTEKALHDTITLPHLLEKYKKVWSTENVFCPFATNC